MVGNDRFRFVFFHIPKTGGTALHTVLTALDGTREDLSAKSHLSPRHVYAMYPELREYYGWTVVRNPWRRMESAYRHHLPKYAKRNEAPPEFAAWVIDNCKPRGLVIPHPALTPQFLWLTDGVAKYPYDALNTLAIIPRVNVSPKADCIWTQEALDLFAVRYAVDIETLGYRFEGLLSDRAA